MLLRELAAYADRLGGQKPDEELPPMYQRQPIKWLIDLDSRGNCKGFVCTVPDDARGRLRRGKEYPAPFARHSSNTCPQLLAHTAEYALGLVSPQQATHARRASARHRAFVDIVERCADDVAEPSMEAVRLFLQLLNLETLAIPSELAPDDSVAFTVNGALPMELPSIQQWWVSSLRPKESPEELRTCLVCGDLGLPARRHPIPIKGLTRVGGQPSGTNLASADKPAFWSYGLEASLVAPVCQPCAERYARGLNALLDDTSTHVIIGERAYVFWTRCDLPFAPSSLLSDTGSADVRQFILSPITGRHGLDLENAAYFAAGLSASGGRAVVRAWLTTTIGQIRQSLANFLRLQAIVSPSGQIDEPLSVLSIAERLANHADGSGSRTTESLIRFALLGGTAPAGLLQNAIAPLRRGGDKAASAASRLAQQSPSRRRASRVFMSHERAAAIKLILTSHMSEQEGSRMEQLDKSSESQAYACGRLLAVLERIQYLAVNPKTTIVDRFYGSASSAPLTAFPVLLTASRGHLSKLRKSKTTQGTHVMLSRDLDEVFAGITGFPRTLTLSDQGMFAIGYYHQHAEYWRKKGNPKNASPADADDEPEEAE